MSLYSKITLIVLAALSGQAYGQIEFKDAIDGKAFRSLNLFAEACILGHMGREGRIRTIDSHPSLKRMPIPEGSNAAASGRLVWGMPPDTFVILDRDMQCTAVISDEAIRERMPKFIEGTAFGKTGGSQYKFVPLDLLSEKEVDDFKSRNIDVRTYLLRLSEPGRGVYLTLETAIDPRKKGYPVRMTAAYVQIDESKLKAK